MENFEDWLAEQGFERKYEEFYECPGNHIWHVSEVVKLYREGKQVIEGGKENDKI